MHGHNYEIVVKLEGSALRENMMLYDVLVLRRDIEESVLRKYDHNVLNKYLGDYATMELFAARLYNELRDLVKKYGLSLKSVAVFESEGCGVEYYE